MPPYTGRSRQSKSGKKPQTRENKKIAQPKQSVQNTSYEFLNNLQNIEARTPDNKIIDQMNLMGQDKFVEYLLKYKSILKIPNKKTNNYVYKVSKNERKEIIKYYVNMVAWSEYIIDKDDWKKFHYNTYYSNHNEFSSSLTPHVKLLMDTVIRKVYQMTSEEFLEAYELQNILEQIKNKKLIISR